MRSGRKSGKRNKGRSEIMEVLISDGTIQVVRSPPDPEEYPEASIISLCALCSWCGGTGEFQGRNNGSVPCPHCNGTGEYRITLNPRDWNLILSTEREVEEVPDALWEEFGEA